jgi:hypothetical protein
VPGICVDALLAAGKPVRVLPFVEQSARLSRGANILVRRHRTLQDMYPDSLLAKLTPLFAIVTLPLGILAAIFVSTTAAVVVFVVGWLLLTPATAVLSGPSPWLDDDIENLVGERVNEARQEGSGERRSKDPVETLRERYARGEIDEVELERRLDALLETEAVDPDDEESIERAIDSLDTGNSGGGGLGTHDTGTEGESEGTELERDRA